MLTSEELKVLRGRGAKDADILKEYSEFDPESAGDIQALLKRGESPSKVLDGLAEFYGSDDAPKESKPDPMADKGIGQKALGALQFGGANLARGLAKTAKAAGYEKTAGFLESGAKSIAPAPGTYDPAGSRFDVMNPSTYGYAPRALVEGAPGLAADLAGGAVGSLAGPAGAVAGFGAVNAARNFGPNLEARMEHQAPGAEPSGTDYAAAGASTAAEAALSRLGLSPALSGVAKGAGLKAMAQVPGLIAKAAGVDAAAGAAGDVVNQVGRTAGTKDGLSVDAHEAANVAGLSGMTGGAIRAARGVADVTNAARFSGVDESAAARAVARMDATGIEPSNAKTAFERVEMASKTGNAELNDAHQVLRPLLKSKGNDTDLDETRTLVKTTMTQLKANGEANPEHLNTLRERLGDTQEGSRLIDLMEERNALNQMASKGNYDAKDGSFAGGIAANKTVDGLLNPRHYLGAKLLGGAGVAGVAELPMFAQIGVLGPALAKLAAAQAGTYGAVRTLDNVTGMRNPAKEFSERFRGLQGDDNGANLPSFRQEAADQAAEAQAARDQARSAKGQTGADKAEFRDNSRSLKEAVQFANATRKLREGQEAEAFKDNSADLKQAVQSATATRKRREATEADAAKQVLARGKQEDTAWAQKRAQEAQDARNAQQADKAWSQREAAPEARQAQEEAMWRANEAERAQALNDDLTAQEGIQSGLKALAAKALAAQQARGKQEDTAWTQKGRQDAQEAAQGGKVQRDYGRAEAQRSARTPEATKRAQEEAMWRDQEAPGGPSDWSDQDAISAIQKELGARQKASEYLVKQSKKDTPKKVEQPVQQAQASVAPPSLRERIEDAYLAHTGGKTAQQVNLDVIRKALPDVDRATMDKELLKITSGDKEGGSTARLSQWSDPKSISQSVKDAAFSPAGEPFHLMWLQGKMPRKAPEAEPEAVPEALKVRVRAKAKAEKAAEPKAEDVNPDVYRFTHGDQTVDRSKDGIDLPQAYGAKVRRRMADRQDFASDFLEVAGSDHKSAVTAMLTKLNNTARHWHDDATPEKRAKSAANIIEDTIHDLPDSVHSDLWDVYLAHEGKLRGTFDK